jgi:hypothetical protein
MPRSNWQEHKWRRARLWELGLKRDEYEKYLESPHWQECRKLKLDEQRDVVGYNFCEKCGGRPEATRKTALNVHHLTYERLGNELLDDLQIICRPCHDKEHGRDLETQKRWYDPRRFE